MPRTSTAPSRFSSRYAPRRGDDDRTAPGRDPRGRARPHPRRRRRPALRRHGRRRASAPTATTCAAFLGRADVGELFTPLDVWTGTMGARRGDHHPGPRASSPGASPAAPAPRSSRASATPAASPTSTSSPTRSRSGSTASSRSTSASCASSRGWTSRRCSPTSSARRAGEAPTAVELPPLDQQCPHCFEPVRKDADFCPACGRHIGPKPPRSKKPFIILAIVLLLLLLLLILLIAVLSGDEKPAPPKPKPTATAVAETPAPTEAPPAADTRRISGPGWQGQAPRSFKVTRSGGGDLRVHVLTDGDTVIRIFHTPKEKANPGTFETGKRKALKSNAEDRPSRDRQELRDRGVQGADVFGPVVERPGLGRVRDHRQRHLGREVGRGEGDRRVDRAALTA